MGGIVTQIGDTVIDGTVRHRLEQLRKAFATSCGSKGTPRRRAMAELTISTADIAAALRKNLEGFTPKVEITQVGRVLEVGDGIARVSGLPEAAVNELLEFEDGTWAWRSTSTKSRSAP